MSLLIVFLGFSLLAEAYQNKVYNYPDPNGWYLHSGYAGLDFILVKNNPQKKRSIIFSVAIPQNDVSEIKNRILETVKNESTILNQQELINEFSVPYLWVKYKRKHSDEIGYLVLLIKNRQAAILYFNSDSNVDSEEMSQFRVLVSQFSFNKKSYAKLWDMFLPRAYALDENRCEVSSAPKNMTSLKEIEQRLSEKVLSTMMSCAHGVGDGVWESTGGRLESISSCLKNPVKCAHSAVDGIRNIYNLMENLKDSIIRVSQYLKPDDLVALSCSLAGSIGTDLILIAATSGATAAKLAGTVANIGAKMSSLLKILSNTGKLKVPIEILSQYKTETLEKVSQLLNQGKLRRSDLETQLLICAKP